MQDVVTFVRRPEDLSIEKVFELLWNIWILRVWLVGPATDDRDVFIMLEDQITYGI